MMPSKNRYRKLRERWLPNGQRLVYYQCRVTGNTFALNLGRKHNRSPIHGESRFRGESSRRVRMAM